MMQNCITLPGAGSDRRNHSGQAEQAGHRGMLPTWI